jgi:hypothetical protein
MSYCIKVCVRLPDGSFQYLPIAKWNDPNWKNKPQDSWDREIVQQATEQDAQSWANLILPDCVVVEKIES